MTFKSEDNNYTLRIGGRIMADAAQYNDDVTALNDGSEIRRLRIKLRGKIHKDWRYAFSYDAAATKGYHIKGTYLGYYGTDNWRIKLGNLQQPFSLEELTSSKNITFMERSLINCFAPSYALGMTANTWGKNWSATFGVFDDSIADNTLNNDGATSIAARLAYYPVRTRHELLHLGISTVQQDIGTNQTITFNTRPESHYTDVRLLSTGTLSNVDSNSRYGLEAAWVTGPWSVQAEYAKTNLKFTNSPDASLGGWYVQGSWFITGEKRRYSSKSGSFSYIKPKAKNGAVELATRISTLNLEDATITGGEGRNITVGLNWYINRYVRMMANYIDVSVSPNRNGIDENADIYQVRMQAWF
jgi:phosphate-selective porin OprO/OprP